MIQYMIPGLWRAMHETIHRYLKKKNEKGNEEREREETSMKKFKKLLVGLLAGAMMLGSMSATAFAADATEPVSTIDYTKRGSLTLYKYYFKNNQPNNLAEGTGEAGETIPKEATALQGAEFSIWRVADIDGNVTIGENTNQKFEVVGDTSDVTKARNLVGDKNADAIKTTGSDGKVVFGKNETGANTLELGYYYVKETKTPANISSTPAEFVVSIPMTNKKTDAGTKWIYDVTVYPKNVKTEAGVTINKVNAAGHAIEANAKFVLQKKDGTTWKYVKDTSLLNETTKSYDYNVANFDDATQFTQGASITGLGNGSYRLFEVSAENGYIMDGTIAYKFTIANNGDIEGDPQYLTYTQSADTDNKKSAIITVKNERPDVEKTVKENKKWQKDADTAANKDIEYRVKVSVPGNIAKLNTFKITDTPMNITDDVNTVELYSDEACEQKITQLKEGKDYTITSNENGFILDFIKADTKKVTETFADYANQDIYVHYKAKLTGYAVTTVDGNPNTVKLDYSNGIYPKSNETDKPNPGKEQDHAYIEDKAVVYTFKFTIKKTDKDSNELKGANFALYKCDNAGLTSETEIKKGTKVKEWTDENISTFEADKLEAGYYYVIETKAPEGYNLLTKPVEIKELNVQYKTEWTTTSTFKKDENGAWHLVKREKTSATFKYDKDASNTGLNFTGVQTIVNKKGFVLPVTGGMGTIAITALGVALAFAGVLIIGASRKKTVK